MTNTKYLFIVFVLVNVFWNG